MATAEAPTPAPAAAPPAPDAAASTPPAASAAGTGAGASAAAPHLFRFMGGTTTEVDSQLATDLPRLSALNPDQLTGLADTVVAFLKSPDTSDLMAGVDAFAAKYGVSKGALKSLVRSLLVFIKGSLKHGSTPDQLQADLLALRLPESHATHLANHWRKHLVELSLGAVGSSLKVNQLVDMDWSFGVTVASDELESVGATYLQMRLVIDQGGSHRTVCMELTLPQFYEFLSQMEKAQTFVDFLSS